MVTHRTVVCKFYSTDCFCTLLIERFNAQKIFILIKSRLLFFKFLPVPSMLYIESHCQMHCPEVVYCCFSSKYFSFIVTPLTHFELACVCVCMCMCMYNIKFQLHLHADIQFSQDHLLVPL